ncbi:hypothetical protein FE391_23860 [Nonomuraea sp. KC401]|uniref:DUF6886 family protein n=1 Tax=unclassified Nonomuraea TaxID=2593643 RepID=UPI0010FEC8E0|nr:MULTISPECIES: DUF6886 family protein [unclassified Nonomuraea]NBE96781.1 hypothetical protein [Nonomuraea sp. K271]TLF67909.1 hypothetical protein FE391_23860 [Nonomuraea sp. KC401]
MRPGPGEVLHFSEDPTIERFVPHVAPTSVRSEPYVWAVGHDRCPDYWFPRACPRAMAWAGPRTTQEDLDRIVGAGCGDRVHAVEYGWLGAMMDVRLYAYRLPDDDFKPIGEPPHAMVATVPVTPLGSPEQVGDVFELHEEAGIQLRVMTDLWPFWNEVTASSLEFSGIRLRNARR